MASKAYNTSNPASVGYATGARDYTGKAKYPVGCEVLVRSANMTGKVTRVMKFDGNPGIYYRIEDDGGNFTVVQAPDLRLARTDVIKESDDDTPDDDAAPNTKTASDYIRKTIIAVDALAANPGLGTERVARKMVARIRGMLPGDEGLGLRANLVEHQFRTPLNRIVAKSLDMDDTPENRADLRDSIKAWASATIDELKRLEVQYEASRQDSVKSVDLSDLPRYGSKAWQMAMKMVGTMTAQDTPPATRYMQPYEMQRGDVVRACFDAARKQAPFTTEGGLYIADEDALQMVDDTMHIKIDGHSHQLTDEEFDDIAKSCGVTTLAFHKKAVEMAKKRGDLPADVDLESEQ